MSISRRRNKPLQEFKNILFILEARIIGYPNLEPSLTDLIRGYKIYEIGYNSNFLLLSSFLICRGTEGFLRFFACRMGISLTYIGTDGRKRPKSMATIIDDILKGQAYFKIRKRLHEFREIRNMIIHTPGENPTKEIVEKLTLRALDGIKQLGQRTRII